MQILARSRHRGMAEGRLHQMDGSAPIEAMAGMSVAEPVRTNALRDSSTTCRSTDDPQDLRGMQRSAPATAEYRLLILSNRS